MYRARTARHLHCGGAGYCGKCLRKSVWRHRNNTEDGNFLKSYGSFMAFTCKSTTDLLLILLSGFAPLKCRGKRGGGVPAKSGLHPPIYTSLVTVCRCHLSPVKRGSGTHPLLDVQRSAMPSASVTCAAHNDAHQLY